MPVDEAPRRSRGGAGRLSIRHWRVSTRLYAILLIPVVVALALGGFRVQSSVETWREAQDAERTAQLVRAAATYGDALIRERDVTAEPLLAGQKDDPVVEKARAATDTARQAFHRQVAHMPDREGLHRRLTAFTKAEPQLEPLRRSAYTQRFSAVETEEGYVKVQHPLMEFANELGLGTGNITSYGRTVYAISLAKAAASLQRSIGTHLLVKPATEEQEHKLQLTAFASYAYLENIALAEFRSGGTPRDEARLRSAVAQARADGARKVTAAKEKAEAGGRTYVSPPSMKEMTKLIGSGAGRSALAGKGVTASSWFATATSAFDAYRGVEKELTNAAVRETQQIASTAQRDAVINAAVVLLALITAFAIAAMMARSMSRSMLRLRGAAFEVAQQRLPSLVDQLSRTEPGRVDTRVTPIPIDSRDEIGEVARAFDHVHREAVRLAAEQALLRGNVSAIFTNLSQRNQGLIERQLELITALETNEAEPDQLENLFRLDHLATRMRRNGENLLVLAGEEPGRRWTRPVPLVDVLRAAASEVEQYGRIELVGVSETDIHGAAVTDLVHLLAELLENATTFSSPQSKVTVTATRLPDGRVMIEIHDLGIGLTTADFADINHKLAKPPTVDATISQRMGLFVVGRLADRHGIRVQLRPAGEQVGTTSLVMLPEAITDSGDEPEEQAVALSRTAPQQPEVPLGHHLDSRAAAELGFDDSRYETARPAPKLEPVGRSAPHTKRFRVRAAQPPTTRSADHEGGGTTSSRSSDAARLGHERVTDAQQYGREKETTAPGPQAQTPVSKPQQSRSTARSEHAYEIAYEPSFPVEPEPQGPDAPPDGVDRVGFDRPGPAPGSCHSVTDAGLPRRERQWQQSEAAPVAEQHHVEPSTQPLRQRDDSGWRSSNDARWQRAEQLRDPRSGGVTQSGLPRRVPRANLVEGTAAQTPQDGPQVSRAPEDVRGRLSNLHRGVQRGRGAELDDNDENDRQGFGPRQ